MSASLVLSGASVSRGPQLLINQSDLSVQPGHRIGLVGPNGIGKSTLLAALAGELSLDQGSRSVAPATATIGWLRQEPIRSDETVRILLGRRTGVADAQQELDAATADLASAASGAADRYDAALQRWLDLGAADLDARIGEVAARLGFDERLLDQPTSTLSGGEAARIGLAGLLLSRFDLYLLDEPTNDLDLDGLAVLERWVTGLDAGVVVVSHDRTFLERVVTDVAEIDHHSHTISVFGGGWTAYQEERERARALAATKYQNYEADKKDLARRAQTQREWAQQGQSKVRSSGETDKHIKNFRMNQTEKLAGKSAQTKRAMERLEEVEAPWIPWELQLEVPDAGRSGDVVARLSGAVVDRGEFRLGPIDLLVGYGERIAILGANGAGKSTLIDLIIGRIEPDEGLASQGSGLVVGEVEQTRQQLTDAANLFEAFSTASGLGTSDTRTLLAKFGLFGPHIERPTESLSPGERTRAALALLMAAGANLLVLDEPTNHLDMPAIEQLEQALETFAGTVLLVTHDRSFLDRTRVARSITVAEGAIQADVVA